MIGKYAGCKPTHIVNTGVCCHDIAVQGFANLVETIVRGWRGQRHQNHHRDDNGEPAWAWRGKEPQPRSEEHTSELQSRGHLVCRLLLEIKKESITFRCRNI